MSRKPFYFILISNYILSIVVYYPNIQLQMLDHGFIWAIFIGVAIEGINSFCLIKTLNKFGNKNINELMPMLFGKFIGKILVWLYIIVNTFTAFFILTAVVLISQKYVMPSTPAYYVGMMVMFVMFTIFKGSEKSMLNCIAYTATVMIIYFWMFAIICLKEIDIRHIKVTVINSLPTLPHFNQVVSATFFFSGAEAIMVYNPSLPKLSVGKTMLVHAIIGIPMALIIILIPVGVWGSYSVRELNLPMLASADAIGLNLFIIERVLFVLFPLIFLITVKSFCEYMYLGFTTMNRLLNNQVKLYSAYGLISVVFLYAVNKMYDLEKIVNWGLKYGYIWFIYHCTLPILILLFSRRVGGSSLCEK